MDSYVTEKNLNQKTKSVIDKYLEKEHSKLSIVVINKDKSWILNFDQDLKTKTDVKNDKYDIGSLSKTMTSLFVLHTIKNNKLNFDDTVDKYLNLKEGCYPTIYQLLSHTCNYNHFSPIGIVLPSLLTKRYSKRNIYEKINGIHIIKALERRRKNKIKNEYGYSDFSYSILTLVLEEVYKKSFYELINEFIQNHLKLNNTHCINESDQRVGCYHKNKKLIN